jgi:hypothetical protein
MEKTALMKCLVLFDEKLNEKRMKGNRKIPWPELLPC